MNDEYIESLFGDSGNFTDFWLGYPPSTNTFLSDNERWISAELVLRVMRAREIDSWNANAGDELNDDALESMVKNQWPVGGGMQGGTPELLRLRSALIAVGRTILKREGQRRA